MATAAAAVEPNSEESAAAPAEPKGSGGRRRLILLGAPVALVGTGAGLWFSGLLPGLLGMRHAEKTAETEAPLTPVYFDLPELIANLNSNPQRPSYVKLTVRLEVMKPPDKVAFCGYHGWHDWYLAANLGDEKTLAGHLLPGLEPNGVPQELRGSAGTYRLREKLIARANLAAAPAKITDVLFTQMLIQ